MGMAAPIVGSWGIETHGWRATYVILAAFPALIGLPIIFAFFKEKTSSVQELDSEPSRLTGVTFQAALRDYRFWLIAFGFLVISFGIGGSITNLFPLFLEAGYGPAQAGAFMGTIGISVIVGRISTGLSLIHI